MLLPAVLSGGGYKMSYEQDTVAEHIGSVYQNRFVLAPADGPRGRCLVVSIHGSNGDATANFMQEPDNNPNYRTKMLNVRGDFHTGIARSGLHLVTHDFWAINPVTGLMDDAQFASAKLMAIIDSMRTDLAPKLGCRTDKIILIGESQGSMDCMFYLLQWPERVAACFLVWPGGDIEIDRMGGNATPINQNWGRPATQAPQLALLNADGSLGPLLTLKSWAANTTYSVNDYIMDPSGLDNGFGGIAYRCTVGFKSGAAFNKNDGHWAPLDPLHTHFAIPGELGLTSGGAKASLSFPASSPLSGKVAALNDPANLTRFKQITAGTLPTLNGYAVPVYAYCSHGDIITNGGTLNGVSEGFPFLATQAGFDVTWISNEFNHAGQNGAPEPIDPQWATTLALNAVGNAMTITPGANNEVLVQLTAAGAVAVIFEQFDGTSWTPVPVRASVGVRANTGGAVGTATEGASIASGVVTAAGFWRLVQIPATATQIRVRRTGGGNVTAYGGPVYPPGAQAAAWPWQQIYQRMLDAA